MHPILLPVLLFAPQLPPMPAMTQSSQQRFIDFSEDLDRRSLIAVVGPIDKLKEGKRERLDEGKLGNSSGSVSVSGTQYFKVPVTGQIQPRTMLIGSSKDKVTLEFDQQVARLPDGKERRQAMTGNAPQIEAATLALWVLVPRDKGRGMELLHVVPFDAAQDKGADAEGAFTDTMRDFVAINQRLHGLKQALADLEGAKNAEAKAKARDALRAIVDAKFECQRPDVQAMATGKLLPYEKRARDRLSESE